MTNNLQVSQFIHSGLISPGIFRLFGSMFSGALVTLALFAGMHAMISQENASPVQIAPTPLINIIMPEVDETVREIKTPPAPPETRELPQTPRLVPDAANESDTFADPNISVPQVEQTLSQPSLVLEQQPRPMVRVPPQYPNNAASKGIEGYVTLTFSVNSRGEVEDVQVIDANPKGVFEKEARRALRKWKYQPRIEQGNAVAMQGLAVTLDFRLDN